MQLLDRCFEALASTLRHPLALGIAAAGVLLPLAKSQTLTGTFQCQSIVINYATGPSSLAVGFTTPATVAGRNPQLPLNGEFEYYPGNLNLYQSFWCQRRFEN